MKSSRTFFMALLLNFTKKTNYICLKPKTMNKTTFYLLLLIIASACGVKNTKNMISEMKLWIELHQDIYPHYIF